MKLVRVNGTEPLTIKARTRDDNRRVSLLLLSTGKAVNVASRYQARPALLIFYLTFNFLFNEVVVKVELKFKKGSLDIFRMPRPVRRQTWLFHHWHVDQYMGVIVLGIVIQWRGYE